MTGTMESYRLTYFNKRGGGEIIRLVFVVTSQTFEDERLTSEEWLKRKEEMPMKSLPVLHVKREDKETTFCQSGAIAKYLAKKFGIHGENEDEGLLVDEVYDCVGDVRKSLVQIHFCKDETTKADLQKKLISEVLPNFCQYFQRRKASFGEGGYIVGGKISLADLAVFNMVDSCLEMGLKSLWQPYPELLKHRELIMENEKLSDWLKTRPVTEV
ncbi:glutathione S-transferase 3-like [Mya arenaria]|uniref:glutathione S-transferase 3-like n=1 Tax=Mya arenaria TaxID=6604 RepID=UPI0022E1F567|nr:glutathione S-transferase 3-like [Mya arenaria]